MTQQFYYIIQLEILNNNDRFNIGGYSTLRRLIRTLKSAAKIRS